MMTRKTLLGGALAATAFLSLGTLGAAPLAAHAATPAAAVPASTRLAGILQPGFATTAPTSLQVVTAQGITMTVNVSTTTQIVRRYNGQSALDELSAGDKIGVSGSMSGTTTITATTLKDVTIQRAFTRNVGRITAISSDMTRLTVRVLRDSRAQGHNPFDEGSTIYVAVTPTMTVTLADGSQGTVQDSLSPGLVITTLGVFNRNSHSFGDVSRIRVWSPAVGQTTEVHGILQAGFSATQPATLTLQTPYHGLVTVGVGSSAKLVRRYNGASNLAEFSAGDRLAVVATYLGNSSYSATAIKNVTIQKAFSSMVGQIKTISGNTLTVRVLANSRAKGQNPFRVGESLTQTVSPQTVITLADGTAGTIASLQPGMRFYTLGVVDRKAHAFVSVARIHLLS